LDTPLDRLDVGKIAGKADERVIALPKRQQNCALARQPAPSRQKWAATVRAQDGPQANEQQGKYRLGQAIRELEDRDGADQAV